MFATAYGPKTLPTSYYQRTCDSIGQFSIAKKCQLGSSWTSRELSCWCNCKHGVHMHCLAISVGISKISKSMRPHALFSLRCWLCKGSRQDFHTPEMIEQLIGVDCLCLHADRISKVAIGSLLQASTDCSKEHSYFTGDSVNFDLSWKVNVAI